MKTKYLAKKKTSFGDGMSFSGVVRQVYSYHVLMQSMWETTQYLCKNVEGCKI
jgi:hypothetical protein